MRRIYKSVLSVLLVVLLFIYSVFLIIVGKRSCITRINKLEKDKSKLFSNYYISDYWVKIKQEIGRASCRERV